MKAIGYRLVFEKIKKKKISPVLLFPVSEINKNAIQPVLFVPKEERYTNIDSHIDWKLGCEEKASSFPVKITPVVDAKESADDDYWY